MKFAASLVTLASSAAALYTDSASLDRVTSLPDMGTFDKFGAFSGYLDIPDTTKKIHYLFFEA